MDSLDPDRDEALARYPDALRQANDLLQAARTGNLPTLSASQICELATRFVATFNGVRPSINNDGELRDRLRSWLLRNRTTVTGPLDPET